MRQIDCRFYRRKIKRAKFSKENLDESLAIHQINFFNFKFSIVKLLCYTIYLATFFVTLK